MDARQISRSASERDDEPDIFIYTIYRRGQRGSWVEAGGGGGKQTENCKRKTQTTRRATKVCRYKKCGLLEWPPRQTEAHKIEEQAAETREGKETEIESRVLNRIEWLGAGRMRIGGGGRGKSITDLVRGPWRDLGCGHKVYLSA